MTVRVGPGEPEKDGLELALAARQTEDADVAEHQSAADVFAHVPLGVDGEARDVLAWFGGVDDLDVLHAPSPT